MKKLKVVALLLAVLTLFASCTVRYPSKLGEGKWVSEDGSFEWTVSRKAPDEAVCTVRSDDGEHTYKISLRRAFFRGAYDNGDDIFAFGGKYYTHQQEEGTFTIEILSVADGVPLKTGEYKLYHRK